MPFYSVLQFLTGPLGFASPFDKELRRYESADANEFPRPSLGFLNSEIEYKLEDRAVNFGMLVTTTKTKVLEILFEPPTLAASSPLTPFLFVYFTVLIYLISVVCSLIFFSINAVIRNFINTDFCERTVSGLTMLL